MISIKDRKISRKKQFDIRRGQDNKIRDDKKLNFARFAIVAFSKIGNYTKRCPAIQWGAGRHAMIIAFLSKQPKYHYYFISKSVFSLNALIEGGSAKC